MKRAYFTTATEYTEFPAIFTEEQMDKAIANSHGFLTDDSFWFICEADSKEAAKAEYFKIESHNAFCAMAEADHP